MPSRLWVPDGTWRQTRRMRQRSAILLGAESVSVSRRGPLPSLRRPPSSDQVSTGEAIALALGVLESPALEARLRAGLRIVVERSLRLRR